MKILKLFRQADPVFDDEDIPETMDVQEFRPGESGFDLAIAEVAVALGMSVSDATSKLARHDSGNRLNVTKLECDFWTETD